MFKVYKGSKMPLHRESFHFHTMVQEFIDLESQSILTPTKLNMCMTPPIGLPLFSNQHFFSIPRDIKGVFKACNGT